MFKGIIDWFPSCHRYCCNKNYSYQSGWSTANKDIWHFQLHFRHLFGYEKIYSVQICANHRNVEVRLQNLTNTIYNFSGCSIGNFNVKSVTRLYDLAVFLRGRILRHFGRNIIINIVYFGTLAFIIKFPLAFTYKNI